VPLEQRVEATVDGFEVRLEDQYSIKAIEVQELQDNSAGGGVRARCWSKTLEKRAQRERVADASNELASWQRGRRLFNAREEGAASDGVRGVEDCTCWVRVVFDLVKVLIVSVVGNLVALGVVQTLLAAASLGAAVLTVSLLSKRPLGTCWARR
jgi:hypothetical protein